MEKKNIYIVLTRCNTVLSNIIHWYTRDDYTHVALALDKELGCMYSFSRRHAVNPFIGCFRQEWLDEGVYAKHYKLPGVVMEMSVTLAEYDNVVKLIDVFLSNSHKYKYNYIGLICNLSGIEISSRNRFFCSEFVYYVLNQCGICDFGRSRCLMRPQNFLQIGGKIIYEGDLKQYA